MVPSLKRWTCGAAALTLLVAGGCQDGQWRPLIRKAPPPEPKPRPAAVQDPVLAGSIATLTFLANVEPQPVRGFGIVIGLGENGSRDCPTAIRDYLIEVMTKEAQTWGSLEQRRKFSASELIDSLSTAVVEVVGAVGAGAPKGTRFDIEVRAIPGTATRSLAGGLLLPCELKIADPGASDEELLGGTVVARAGGPVFVNPFAASARAAGAVDLRRGTVLGGGHTIEGRPVRLLLREPSYPTARRLERRVNERFGQRPPAAEAMSRGYLYLHTPAEYATRPQEFLQLVPHLYLDDHPVFVENKLRELARLIVLAGADGQRISLAWEGIGRTAVPPIKPLCSHSDPQVRFYAARAGLRLKDVDALPVLAGIAAGANPSLALLALKELGRCPYPQAALKLAPLVDHPSPEIRIAAYEALLNHRSPLVHSQPFPSALDPMQLNLVLDTVTSHGPPLIYVRRTRTPRIVVFAPATRVTVPLFYSDADDTVTVTAASDAADITLFTKHAGRLSEPLLVPPRVPDLIAALSDLPAQDKAGSQRGVGLPYSHVVQVLAALCRDGTIPAHLEIERLAMTEIFGPERGLERPESDDEPATNELANRRDATDGAGP